MTQACVSKARGLRWLTCKMDPAAREAVWKAAEEVSAGGASQSLSEFVRPLPWPEKLKILLPWGIWVNLIENPMLVVGGVLAVIVLTINLLSSTIDFILPGATPDAGTVAAELAKGREGELKQIQEFLKGK